MAILDSIFSVTGSLDNLSFYKVKGSDKIHVLRKGGVCKKRMKTDPSFAIPRLHQQEFDGSTMAGQLVAQSHPAITDACIQNYYYK